MSLSRTTCLCNVFAASLLHNIVRVSYYTYTFSVCACECVKSHLTSGGSVRPENVVMYSAGNKSDNFVGFF